MDGKKYGIKFGDLWLNPFLKSIPPRIESWDPFAHDSIFSIAGFACNRCNMGMGLLRKYVTAQRKSRHKRVARNGSFHANTADSWNRDEEDDPRCCFVSHLWICIDDTCPSYYYCYLLAQVLTCYNIRRKLHEKRERHGECYYRRPARNQT